jgi:hypothetical protein
VGEVCGVDADPFGLVGLILPILAHIGGCQGVDSIRECRVR